MKTHKDLDVWKLSVDFVTDNYKVTSVFPKEEQFCLNNQIRRASVSIPSNITEGAARNSDKKFLRFLYIAMGSIQEIDTQLLITLNLKFVSISDFDQLTVLLEQIAKMVNGLIKSVKSRIV